MKAEAVRSDLSILQSICSGRMALIMRLALVFALQAALFIPYSLQRFIARDEGYYALASKLVTQGKVLYSDFFYTQMPLLPYLYGSWMKLFGYDWLNIRVLSALFVALIGVLIFERLKQRSLTAAIAGLFLFCTSHFIYAWYLTIQTYALAILLLFAAYLCFENRKFALAGLFLGLATCTRLYLIAVLFPFGVLMFYNSGRRKGLVEIKQLTLGLIIGLLPAAVLFVANPLAFYFNNLGFHLGRSDMPLKQNLWTKWVITKSLFHLKDSDKFVGAEFLLLTFCSLGYFVDQIRKRVRLDSVMPLVLMVYVVSLLPTPAYIQYFAALIPFLIVAAVESGFSLVHRTHGAKRKFVYSVIAILVVAYVSPLKENLEKYTVSAVGVPGIGISKDPDDWKVSTIRRIGLAIDKNATPGETVLTLWPGYLVNSEAAIYPGFENHFGWKFAPKMTDWEKQISNIASLEDGIRAVASGLPKVVILSDREYRRYFRGAITSGGYEVAAKVENVNIFSRN